MCLFAKYSDFFGAAGTGVHSIRFLNTAIVDYILSLLLSVVITFFSEIPLVLTTISVLLLGILGHFLFGVTTNTLKYLNLLCN